ncbi:arsenate reductase [Gluconacetobacter johannae DSM 13595]|uniref:Arsenate reductase n=1 Tax=Gluconacetobacter johannae TaxID=112140 RepID=A0A7W4P3V0_9PROT|nr:arsenate reductase (glutaredoxin) [Gluconacetobacter johannae]MBB2174418.1 arsenate reductase (glutaredoxin) [Gluconacetobacter johannae]GBQ84936.1 arsenate reductase [Gluconacetobacter johannae DSM 13595]
MSDVTIWHNPRCGTSRKVLDLLRAEGIEPAIVFYLQTPPDRATLAGVIARAGLSVREAIRTKEAAYRERGLGDPALDDAAVLDAMLADPVLIERPFVTTPRGARLCRPAERVREIL